MTPTPQDHAQAVREALDEYESALVAGAEFRHQREAVRAARDALLAVVRAQAVAEERARWEVVGYAPKLATGVVMLEHAEPSREPVEEAVRSLNDVQNPEWYPASVIALSALTPTPRGPTDGE